MGNVSGCNASSSDIRTSKTGNNNSILQSLMDEANSNDNSKEY